MAGDYLGPADRLAWTEQVFGYPLLRPGEVFCSVQALRQPPLIAFPAMLHLERVDLHLTKNKSDHHTSDYASNQLIVRRGQAFEIALLLNRPLKDEDYVAFEVETGKSPNIAKGTKAAFPLSTKEVTNERWRAVTNSTASSSVTVSITPPVTAVIGAYQLSLRFFTGACTSHNLFRFTLLFNPWASDDDVYLADESERHEYVLKDSTIIYNGNKHHISHKGWNLGQFEEGILGICLLILEKQKMVDGSLFHDPKEVSRVCSAMINSNDDKGVVHGNWSGHYDGGRSPTSWSGSVAILKKWETSGPVRYGQCWVFAGVLCTVMRCLGIPSRVVTNFSSAHDTNKNLSIDVFYDAEGNNLESIDSIWNFHVWNEAWFSRHDLGSYYDGWQVLDATPQEKSNDIYRLGPTSVKAIKKGDVHLNYDGPFVFSEVNADKISWIYHKGGESFERLKTSINSVGKFTSTKAVGSNDRVDITYNYKYKEGTADEREAYHNALFHIFGRRTVGDKEMHPDSIAPARTSNVPQQSIHGRFKELQAKELGQDIDLTLVLLNDAPSDHNLTVNFNVNATSYTRRVVRKILNESQPVSLPSKSEKEISFKIPYSKYINHLQDDKVVEVTALCTGDTMGKLLLSQIITFKNPSINITVLGDAVIHNPVNAEITFQNPLDEVLNDCDVFVEGSGLIKGQFEKIISLKPKEETTVKIEFTPYRKGSKQLHAVVHCNRTVTFDGFIMVDVKEA